MRALRFWEMRSEVFGFSVSPFAFSISISRSLALLCLYCSLLVSMGDPFILNRIKDEGDNPVFVDYRPGIGHCVVARRDLKPGDLVMETKPYVIAAVVNDKVELFNDEDSDSDEEKLWISRRLKLGDFGCPICLGETPKPEDILPGGYCSEECRENFEDLITLELKHRKQLARLKKTVKKLCADELDSGNFLWILCQTRLAIRTLLRRYLDIQQGDGTDEFDALMKLEAHAEKEREYDGVLSSIATEIIKNVLPEEICIPHEEIMHMFHVQETNVAQLEDPDTLSEVTARSSNEYAWRNEGIIREGFFLDRAIISHSCHPNTSIRSVAARGGGFVRIVVTEEIKKGEELSTNYTVSGYHPRDLRRIDLWDNYEFLCRCKLCSDPTENGCFMRGVICQEQGCGGCVVPDPKSQESLVECDSVVPGEWKWKCMKCGVAHDADAMWKVNCDAEELSGDALKAETFDEMWKMRTDLLKKYAGILHPGHFILIENQLQLALAPNLKTSDEHYWNPTYMKQALGYMPNLCAYYRRLFGPEGLFWADHAYIQASMKLRLSMLEEWGADSLRLMRESKKHFEEAHAVATTLRWPDNVSVQRIGRVASQLRWPIICDYSECGKSAGDDGDENIALGMKRCSRCRLAFFCSKECQKKAWSKHKQWCKLPWGNDSIPSEEEDNDDDNDE